MTSDPFLKDLPDEARATVAQKISTASDAFTEGVVNWGFEVIKHLAIFNGGGLAGAAALAQAYNTDAVVHRLTLNAIHLFVAGLILALITMVVCWIAGFFYNFFFIRKCMAVLLSAAPLSTLKLSWGIWVASGAVWLLAAASVTLFLMGAFKVVAIA